MKRITFLTSLLLAGSMNLLQAKVIHVSPAGPEHPDGTASAPYTTISRAASQALAGDTVLVHAGTYREWVSPSQSGFNDSRRIVYLAQPGEEVVIKGSERIQSWKKVKNNIWKATIDNTLFGDFNPYTHHLAGDWLDKGQEYHLGEVYSEEEPLQEVLSPDSLTAHTWYVQTDDRQTTLLAHFGGVNPNRTLTEINVRPACFFPKSTGMNYITVKGFKMMQAATQWSAPTSEQVGLTGPNWSKGWIIEDCEISHSKCVGICLGKTRASGHNLWTSYRKNYGYMKCGFNREIETILQALDLGWNKETVGSHIIRNNRIHHCEQAGIVGHMGGAFSTLTGNEIYAINTHGNKIWGAETGGIKLHAAIDSRIEHNFIHHCIRGIWLDWQAQGTHVANNLLAENTASDLFVEVSHGPTLIYNNLLLSAENLRINAQGLAVCNNLLAGSIKLLTSPERYTPYHLPHSTKIKGFFENTGGDMRFYNNLFLGSGSEKGQQSGLSVYDAYPVYDAHLGDTLKNVPQYLKIRFPLWTSGNVYCQGATPYLHEQDALRLTDTQGKARLIEKPDGWYLETTYPTSKIKQAKTTAVTTQSLGQTLISEALFDCPDGTPFTLDTDYWNQPRASQSPVAGPFETVNSWKVWDASGWQSH